ncbi:hypothetical protein [Sinomicrobium soli]|uniref:hypothetical protein n=1 Tax=Sinomicrobium sp. N-1-3-6 TaxID=2219864 RepID=UPI000DCC8C30|nr:hypothetical protein [Sinomicrobium sp. N-1-3-6]RAV28579.1 hypothetical protein DN748_13275 [Sinomicrobium sp. N-1-3-6]
METKPFHVHDDDRQIMIKKDRIQAKHWVEHLGFIDREIAYLIKLSSGFREQLEMIRKQNELLISALSAYDTRIADMAECDDMECEVYYLEQHEDFRNGFINHRKQYEVLKEALFSELLAK